MPTVPTYDYPNISPETPPDVRGYATAQTFGAGIGQAVGGIGSEIAKAGDVFSRHAITLMDRENQAAATELFVNAVEKTGELDVKYRSLQGKAAVDFYQNDYVPGVRKIMDEHAGMAGNVEVRRLFQQDFRRRIGYEIVNGAMYSATQLKHWENQTSLAKENLAVKAATDNPSDEQAFDIKKQEVEEAVRSRARTNSWSPEQTELELLTARSKIRATQLNQIAIQDSILAKKMFDKYRGEMDGPTQLAVERHIHQGLVTNGSRVIAEQVMQQDGSKREEYVAEGRRRAEKFAPGDQQLSDTVVSRIETEFTRRRRAEKELDIDRKNAVNAELLDPNKKPLKFEDLSTTAQQAYRDSTPVEQARFNQQFVRNSKTDVPMTIERIRTKQQADGMAISDPSSFASLDIGSLDVDQKTKGELFAKQLSLRKRIDEDTHTRRALAFPGVHGLLVAAGVGLEKDNKDKTDKYNQFLGAFSGEVNEWQQTNKKLINENEAKKIASSLLSVVQKNWFSADKRAFELRSSDQVPTLTEDQVRALDSGKAFIAIGDPSGKIRYK